MAGMKLWLTSALPCLPMYGRASAQSSTWPSGACATMTSLYPPSGRTCNIFLTRIVAENVCKTRQSSCVFPV